MSDRGFADEVTAQRACDVANAALVELGFAPDHEVEQDGDGWFVSTPSWFVTATPEVIYRSLLLGSLAVGRTTVPCFECWNRKRIGACMRPATVESIGQVRSDCTAVPS